MRTYICLILAIAFLSSCNSIETGEDVSTSVKTHIMKLGLLEEHEHIIKFYSDYKSTVAGSFFTDKRLANYWIDEKDVHKNEVSYAYYTDVRSIDTVYQVGATYCPYMEITRMDSTKFRVYADGDHNEIQAFFEDAIKEWMLKKSSK